MKSGQFYRGKIDGIQKHFESSDIDKILPAEKLRELADCREIGEHPRFFKQERVLAKTIVSPSENLDGRQGGVTNHTVLYQFDATVEHDTLQYIFDVETFIAEILAGDRRFKMPEVPKLPDADGVDFGIIGHPPPLEWEV